LYRYPYGNKPGHLHRYWKLCEAQSLDRLAMRRNQSLDVLRCAAVLLVLGFHFPYYPILSRIGWMGVDLFFVLSGFLISGLLYQEYKDTGSIQFKRFILRRSLKIWPSFYLLLAGATAYSLIKPSSLLRDQILYNLVWLQNYHPSNSLILVHTWSLAVEEHFYLFLPILFMALIAFRGNGNPFRAIPALFVFVSAFSLAFRWPLVQGVHASLTHMRMDSLFAGVALGYLYHFKSNWFQKLTRHSVLALTLLLGLLLTLFGMQTMERLGTTVLFAGFSILVAWAVVRPPETWLFPAVWRLAAKIGVYSYSIYLWHTIVCSLVTNYLGWFAWAFWIYVTLAIAVGVAMAHLIELPFLALREKRFPSLAKNAALAVTPVRPDLQMGRRETLWTEIAPESVVEK